MSALEAARDALAWWDQSPLPPHRNVAPAINALRALIAEHERLLATVEEMNLLRIDAEQRAVAALPTPPTDDERVALEKVISNSVMEDFANSRREADIEGRHVAKDVLAAGFRRQGPPPTEADFQEFIGESDEDVIRNEGYEAAARLGWNAALEAARGVQ